MIIKERLGTAKGLALALISFIIFYSIFNKVSANVFMGIYTAVTAIVLLAAGEYKNIRMLLQTVLTGIGITIGYGMAKLAC